MRWIDRFFNTRKDVSILFVPTHSRCAVSVIHEILGQTVSRNYDVHLLALGSRNLASIIRSKKILIFGHPDSSRIGIANSVDSSPLVPSNFYFANKTFEVFGNVCFGRSIFTGYSWSSSVASWISFKSRISICSGSKQLNDFWLKYYNQILLELSKQNSLKAYYPQFRKYINGKIFDLGSEEKFDGHFVVLTCLSGFLNELTDN